MEAITVSEVSTLFGSALHLVALYRQAREQWKQANPNDQGQLPDEGPLFELLRKSGQDLKDHAQAIIDKYAPSAIEPPPVPVPVPVPVPIDPPIPEPPQPPVIEARRGVVRAVGKAVTDDTGMFLPLGMTFFWALFGWKNERDRVHEHLNWFEKKGIDYLRILGQVDWTDEAIDPTWPDYQTCLADFIDAAYARGIRTQVTLAGGKPSSYDRALLTSKVLEVVTAPDRAEKVIALECSNESFANGPDIETLISWARELRRRTPHLVALSAPSDWAEMKTAYAEADASLFTVHTDRGSGDNRWRQVRQGWDFKDLPGIVSSNEPPGPASSVDTNSDPLQLAMMRAVGALSGGAMYVLHCGTGVYGRRDDSRGRQPNIWEVPNIDAIVAAVRGIDKLLPADLPNWGKANTQWTPPNPVAPFQADVHWPSGGDSGVNKAYSALAPGHFIQMPCGVKHQVNLTASYPLQNVKVIDPLTQATVQEHATLSQGQTITVPGRADTMAAYVITGWR